MPHLQRLWGNNNGEKHGYLFERDYAAFQFQLVEIGSRYQ